jgi:sulfane dehydrogenase subunit SoxC
MCATRFLPPADAGTDDVNTDAANTDDLGIDVGGNVVNGAASRRGFLRGVVVAAPALLLAARGRAADGMQAPAGSAPALSPASTPLPSLQAPSKLRAGTGFTPYGMPSRHERNTVRRIAANRDVVGNGVALTPLEDLEGIITPNGLHYERHHNGVPAIDPASHRLVVHGMVQQPLAFAVADLLRYSMRSETLVIECSGNSNVAWHHEPMQRPVGSMHGLVSCSEWTGVPLALLLDEAGVDVAATWAIIEGADGFNFSISLPLAKLRQDCFIGLYQNGERLRPEQGYPLRLIVPGWRGHLHVKWLHRIELASAPRLSRNETAAYSTLMPDGSARIFDFALDVKSLITSPTHGQTLPAPGPVMLSGLAWSGAGAIATVDISTDGGKHWQPATLQTPVLPRAFCRFRYAWNWDGTPAILQSRATDASGAVQPSRAALIAARGYNNFYHFNGIVSWQVEDDGSVSHVYA